MTRKNQTVAGGSSLSFPRPPRSFTDKEGRAIEIRADEFPQEALVEMYGDFASEERAQGLPPTTEERTREWLDVLEEGLNVIAWHVGAETANQPSSETAETAGRSAGQTGLERAIGHAVLLDCGDGTHELTIFVHHEYQLAGIGSRLVRTLLGYGQDHGVERVWLTVQRSNHVAMNLYRSVGFETINESGVEHEMELDL